MVLWHFALTDARYHHYRLDPQVFQNSEIEHYETYREPCASLNPPITAISPNRSFTEDDGKNALLIATSGFAGNQIPDKVIEGFLKHFQLALSGNAHIIRRYSVADEIWRTVCQGLNDQAGFMS